MPLLQVRDFPDDLYAEISFTARREHRTIAQQAIVLIMQGLGKTETNKERRKRVLERVMARKIPDSVKAVDVVAWIREDHNR
ncbi:hypothetical protein AGMMS50293_02120 [Spirochaetia bacterium]|nr:hypothetical protein AGMMS50293_02120 [Spirochaetia bacterium]